MLQGSSKSGCGIREAFSGRENLHTNLRNLGAEQNTGWSGLIAEGFQAVWDVALRNLHVSLNGLKTKLCKTDCYKQFLFPASSA